MLLKYNYIINIMHLVIKPDQYEVNNIMISDKIKTI